MLKLFLGWADAMAKVLRAQKDVEVPGKLLLSKAKKDYERTSKPDDESKPEILSGNKMSAKVIVTFKRSAFQIWLIPQLSKLCWFSLKILCIF